MLIFLNKKASEEEIQKAAQDLDGYVKFVIDLNTKIMTIGGARHVDGEQLLLKEGSKQYDLWGGGLDLETQELDFDSMINIRPRDNNPSRTVLSKEIRDKMSEIVHKLLI